MQTILLTRVGSHAYGTNVEGSDEDFKAVVIPPLSYYLGLDTFKGFHNPNAKDFSYLTEDGSGADITAVHLSKFVREALAGSPANLEILFVVRDHIIEINNIGRKLIDKRDLFLSKQVYRKMRGYANSQIKLMTKVSRGYEDPERLGSLRKIGYDTKSAMHAVRLLDNACRILEEGTFCTLSSCPKFLLNIRKGLFPLEQVTEFIEKLGARLEIASKHTELAEEPDYDEVNKLLIDLTKEGLGITVS